MSQIAIKLSNTFKHVYLDEDKHVYYVNKKRIVPSTSKFISNFYEKFNKPKMLKLSAKKHNIDEKTLETEWETIKNVALDKGNDGHDYAENKKIKELNSLGKKYYGKTKVYKEKLSKKIKANYSLIPKRFKKQNPENLYYKDSVDQFWSDLPSHYIIVGLESRLYTYKYDFAGTADVILYNTITGKFIIVDYKTNKDLYKHFNKYMFFPFDDFIDNKLNHYKVQLNTYQMMLEEYGFEVEDRWIIWTKRNNHSLYTLIKVTEIQNLIHTACESWRNNKQSSKMVQSGNTVGLYTSAS